MSSLRLGSLNANGLNNPDKVWTLKRLLVFYNLSIVGIQDTRISADNACSQKMKNVFDCPSVWSSYCAIIIFDKNIKVKSTRIELDGRVIILNLSLFSRLFSVAVVYVPPLTAPKQLFFEKLSQIDWPTEIIFMGDFNCYLDPYVDHYPSLDTPKPGAEFFSEFCLSAGVADVFSASKSSMHNMSRPITYSRARNFQLSGSRIDAILATEAIQSRCTSSAHIPCSFTDHRLVLSTWSLENKIKTPVKPFINHAFAANAAMTLKIFEEVYEKVANPRIENSPPIQDIWVEVKSSINKTFSKVIKARAAKLKAAHKKAYNILNHLERFSPRVPSKQWTEQWYEAFSTFSRLQRAMEKKNSTMAGYKHLTESETTSPYFLRKMSKKSKFVPISQLQDTNGILHDKPAMLEQISTTYYTDLYSDSNRNQSLIDQFINAVPSPDFGHSTVWDSVVCPIKEEEISTVIMKHPKKKAAGDDGIPYEVYRSNEPLFTMVFLELFNDCLNNLVGLPGSSVSKIILLYKKDDETNLKNWRPISLTNSDYKILTKVLNNRLSKIAMELISPNQYGFIPGRQIWDNIHNINNLLQSRSNITNGYALFLDMEKAYDRISWVYLFSALKRFGAPSVFISWLQLLYSNLESYIMVNSKPSKSFPVCQGLRQGDPMSPILFNFAIDFLLRSINLRIGGIKLSSGPFISHMSFADDTVVCIGSQNDRLELQSILKSYQLASNSKVNIDKTVVVKINNPRFQYSSPPISSSTIFRHLGVLMTSKGLNVAACENLLISSITSQVSRWSYRNISLSGRCIAANIFLLSKVWYLSHIVPFSNSFFVCLRRILQKWFWPKAKRAPIPITSLTRHKKLGGLSLIDPEQQSIKILSKWLIPVINPSSMIDFPAPSWSLQARHNWLRSLKIHRDTLGGLQNFLLQGHKRGPNSLESVWRLALHSFKKSPLIIKSYINPKDRRSTIFSLSTSDGILSSNRYSLPSNLVPRNPMVKNIVPIRPSNDPLWTKLWYASHSKLVPGFNRTITWRTISLSWKSADKMHKESPFYMCAICKNVPATTSHKYFYCPSISFLWQKVYNWLEQNQTSHTFDPLENLFFHLSRLPSSFCIMIFHCVLSVIHYHFIRATFRGSLTPQANLLEILRTTIQAQIDRVWHTKNSQIGNQASVSTWVPNLTHVLIQHRKSRSPQIYNI